MSRASLGKDRIHPSHHFCLSSVAPLLIPPLLLVRGVGKWAIPPSNSAYLLCPALSLTAEGLPRS